jgi:hypothetical protein
MTERTDINYDSIVALGERLDRPTQTLLALTPNNDPFPSFRGRDP